MVAKIELGFPDIDRVTVHLDGTFVATMWAFDEENGIPVELFQLMRAGPDLLALAKRLQQVFEQLEGWRELDATAVDELISSELLGCDQAIDKAEKDDIVKVFGFLST